MNKVNYCSECGARLELKGIHSKYKECVCCKARYYDNPIVGVSGIYLRDGLILLGKRKGRQEDMWCVPCGYLEREDIVEGMMREFKEETNLGVVECQLYDVHSNFHNEDCPTVGVFYHITKVEGILAAQDDLKEVGFFGKGELPELAFPSDKLIIKRLIEEGKM